MLKRRRGQESSCFLYFFSSDPRWIADATDTTQKSKKGCSENKIQKTIIYEIWKIAGSVGNDPIDIAKYPKNSPKGASDRLKRLV
jgi:hypothetical protein